MTIKSILQEATKDGGFSVEAARGVLLHDWRTMILSLSNDTKRDAETLFYFIEGHVEEVDEGFVDNANDPELFERTTELLKKL